MNVDDYLYALVEAGIALSGFAAVAIGVRSRDAEQELPGERIFVSVMIERGLATSLVALLPMLLRSFGTREASIWQFVGLVQVAYGVSVIYRSWRGRSARASIEWIGRRTMMFFFAIGTPMTFLPLVNILPVGLPQGPQWSLLCMTWLLFTAAYYFWFLIRGWVREGSSESLA